MIAYRSMIVKLNLPAEQVIEQNDLLDKVYGIPLNSVNWVKFFRLLFSL